MSVGYPFVAPPGVESPCGHGSYIGVDVSIRDLKNGLSGYVRRVRAGERVVVTDRGRPVAELRALRDEHVDVAERLLRMADAGEITRRRKDRSNLPRLVSVRGEPVSKTLLEDRK